MRFARKFWNLDKEKVEKKDKINLRREKSRLKGGMMITIDLTEEQLMKLISREEVCEVLADKILALQKDYEGDIKNEYYQSIKKSIQQILDELFHEPKLETTVRNAVNNYLRTISKEELIKIIK